MATDPNDTQTGDLLAPQGTPAPAAPSDGDPGDAAPDQIGSLRAEIDSLNARSATAERAYRQMLDFTKRSHEREVADYERKLSELKSIRARAVAAADGDAFAAADEAITALPRPAPPPETPAAPAAHPDPSNDPVFVDWKKANPWFDSNPEMRDLAGFLGAKLRQSGETSTGRAYLDKVAAQMRQTYPRLFAAAPAPAVEGGGARSSGGAASRGAAGAKTFAQMPKADQDAAHMAVEMGFVKDVEAFAKEYWADQAATATRH
jgi:hypothetical protein